MADRAFKLMLLTDSLRWSTRPVPKSLVPKADFIHFNVNYKSLFLEIYCETTGTISDGPLIGELPNQASISDTGGQLQHDSTAQQYLEHFLIQAEGNHLKKLDYFANLDISMVDLRKK